MNFPLVRIELENMRQTIVHALYRYNDEIERKVDEEIKRRIEEFNVEAYIESCVSQHLHQELSHQIQRRLQGIMSDLIRDKDVTNALKTILRNKLEEL